MSIRTMGLIALCAFSVAEAAEIVLPARPADAARGSDFVARVSHFDLATRETAVIAEVTRGNVPAFWRRFVEVKVAGAAFFVSPDYLAIGADDDYFLTPLTPMTAQLIADQLGCVLPTRKMVDDIHRAAPLKLAPAPIAPSAAMTTVPVFAQHNATVRKQRATALATHPLGTLVAGHKKDLVLTPRLAAAPGKVAIYGWHRLDGSAIQPLYLGHSSTWVDYSHGARFVLREMTSNGASTTVDAILADAKLCALLSDEGPILDSRHGRARPAATPTSGEETETLQFDPGVRVMLNTPAPLDTAKPVRLVLYALPAGNSIEQTIGRRIKPGDDWHFDIQHIGAQTRWLRAHVRDANLVIAYLECAGKSWPLWRRKNDPQYRRIPEVVEALRRRFSPAKIVLTGHSAGGSFTFGYLDGIERIPDDIERIAFLDSNYAYDPAKGHDAKLVEWLTASDTHRLCVLAYEDHVTLLNGKTFVSENGGTWGRSRAMLRDLAAKLPFTRDDQAGLQHHTALGGRVKFLLKENPAKVVLHTRQVELNGFIHAMLTGTEHEGKSYEYLGARAYAEWIAAE